MEPDAVVVITPISDEYYEDATVVGVSVDGYAPDISAVTNAAGEFALDMLSEGVWLLHAFCAGGKTGESTIRVTADSIADALIEIVVSEA